MHQENHYPEQILYHQKCYYINVIKKHIQRESTQTAMLTTLNSFHLPFLALGTVENNRLTESQRQNSKKNSCQLWI